MYTVYVVRCTLRHFDLPQRKTQTGSLYEYGAVPVRVTYFLVDHFLAAHFV